MESKTASLDDGMSKKDRRAAALKQKRLSNGSAEQDSSEVAERDKPEAETAENGVICNGIAETRDKGKEDEELSDCEGSKAENVKSSKMCDISKDNSSVDSVNGNTSPIVNGNDTKSDDSSPSGKDDLDDVQKRKNKKDKKNVDTDTSLQKTCDKSNMKDHSASDCDDESQKNEPETDKIEENENLEDLDNDKKDNGTDESSKNNRDEKDDSGNAVRNENEKDDLKARSSPAKDDSEKENDSREKTDGETGTGSPKQTEHKSGRKEAEKRKSRSDSAADDIEIIGESKIIPISMTSSSHNQNVVFVPAGLSSAVPTQSIINQGFSATSTNMLMQGLAASSQTVHSFTTASMPHLSHGFVFAGGVSSQQNMSAQNVSLLTPSVAPPKPKSSLDQIELIRWEIQNRINTRPKYFKPNPTSELGPLAKFLFDIGSDLIKESVYHDLVKIQSKKNDDDKLTDKEREDLEKLKEIEKDLYATIGHLKLKLKKRCKVCNFQTESNNVMYFHKQYPHEDNKLLRCAHCPYSTKQPMAFKFHMEAEHAIQPKLHDKKAFYECDMCPYENNQEQKLVLHKQRCIKQFRPLFNLHPSCLSGAEINLCLENIFYKPVIPKNLKLLQQKHAQQQAALAEARRQQAQMQALAAQKNAAAAAAKKQQQFQQQQQQPKFQPPPIAPRYTAPVSGRLPLPPRIPGQTVRYSSSANVKGPRPTVANMLNQRQQNIPAPSSNPGGFEVCEICGGYVKDRKALRIHFFYAHRIDLPFNLFERNQAPLYCATCYVRFWTAQGLRKHIDTHKEENQTRGVVGKCISCGHHVLNLLLHMRIVHNRELQHYVNALMCMFCGSHYANRVEVERHILRAHGNVDPVTGTLKAVATQPPPQHPQPKHTPAQKKTSSNSLVKGSVCVLCNLNFGRNVDLTRHCMRMHHTCMKCGMVVIDKASLMKHTCLSSPSGTRDCSMCGETGFHPAYYVKHLRDKHLRKFSIRVSKVSKGVIERWTKRPYSVEEPKEVLVEISDSDDNAEEDIVLKKLKPSPATGSPAKRPRMGPACKVKKPREVDETPEVEMPMTDKKGESSKADDAPKEALDPDNTHDASSFDDDESSSPSRKRKSAPDSPETEKVVKRKKSTSSPS